MAKQKKIYWLWKLSNTSGVGLQTNTPKRIPPPNFLMKGQIKVFCTRSKHLNEGHSITCSVGVWVWVYT